MDPITSLITLQSAKTTKDVNFILRSKNGSKNDLKLIDRYQLQRTFITFKVKNLNQQLIEKMNEFFR